MAHSELSASGTLYLSVGGKMMEIGAATLNFASPETFEKYVQETQQADELIAMLKSQAITLSGEINPAAYDPLGVVDHLIWGSTLN